MRASDIHPVTPEDLKTDAAFQAASEIACKPSWTFTDSKKHVRAGGRSILHYADNKCSPELHFARLSRISQKTNKATVNSPRVLGAISSTFGAQGGKSFRPHRDRIAVSDSDHLPKRGFRSQRAHAHPSD